MGFRGLVAGLEGDGDDRGVGRKRFGRSGSTLHYGSERGEETVDSKGGWRIRARARS